MTGLVTGADVAGRDLEAVMAGEVDVATAAAQFRDGAWALAVAIENDAYRTRGKPRGYFPGQIVVQGSPEEREARDARAQRAADALREQHAQALEAEHAERLKAS